MKYKCLIVDDEQYARELIENHLSQLDEFELVASCSNGIEAYKILQERAVDLLFLDIEMPVLKGTDLLKSLRQRPKVIFTTAYRDYAVEGFELEAVDYLLKPIFFDRFFRAIQKFIQQVEKKEAKPDYENIEALPDHIFISKNRKKVKVLFDEINYIESLKDYIKIHLPSETHVVKYSISAFEKELDSRFVRVHRSYIVNRNKITAYTKNDVEINKTEIPIGESYKEGWLQSLKF